MYSYKRVCIFVKKKYLYMYIYNSSLRILDHIKYNYPNTIKNKTIISISKRYMQNLRRISYTKCHLCTFK